MSIHVHVLLVHFVLRCFYCLFDYIIMSMFVHYLYFTSLCLQKYVGNDRYTCMCKKYSRTDQCTLILHHSTANFCNNPLHDSVTTCSLL